MILWLSRESYFCANYSSLKVLYAVALLEFGVCTDKAVMMTGLPGERLRTLLCIIIWKYTYFSYSLRGAR